MARRKDRPAGPLDARSGAILRAIIEEYIRTATPVGSQTLIERYPLGVSSATVRNVMAELEAAGYLRHPHTSAGRVPTDAGYRLYVDGSEPLTLGPVDQLMIRHQFSQVEFASEQWFRLAAATLAGVTRAAGIATPAKPLACRLKWVDLLATGSRLVTVVVVLAEGPIKQVLLALDAPLEQGDLEVAARRLNERLVGLSARQIERRLEGFERRDGVEELAYRAGQRLVRVMREFDAAAVEDVFSEGLLNVMEAPEFAQSEKLRRVFSALQNRDYVGHLVHDVARRGDVQIFIGRENEAQEMQEVSLILAPYGRPGRATGVVGVLGPTRMAYPRAIGTVRYVSGLMNELVEHLYA